MSETKGRYTIEKAGLKPDTQNANQGTQRGRGLLEKSLRKLGAGRSILVDKDGNVIAGNKTLEGAAEIDLPVRIVETDGTELVVVKRTDLDLYSDKDKRARQLAYADNKVAELDLSWKPEQIAVDFTPLELGEWGFDNIFAEPKDAEPQIDRAAELNEKWQVKPGDLWQIGEHRLLCGDSTKREDVERVMGGEKATVFSDAPYGVDIVKNNKVGGEFAAKNGNFSPIVGDETTETAREFYKTCLLCGLADFILWGGNYFTDFLQPSPCWIIWDKRGDLNSNNFADCELAWTSFDKPARVYTQKWMGMIREGEHDKRVHPTQKPVRITSEIMQDFPADIYFDGFAGSGTTLVACQNLSRKCRAIEISPNYCAVILERMATAFPELEIKRVE